MRSTPLPRQTHVVLSRLEAEAKSFRVPEHSPGYEGVWAPHGYIEYWQIPRSSAELLYALANAHRARAILELGTSAGYSAIWLAMAARTHEGRVTTVELAPAKAAMAKRNLAEAGYGDIVDVVNEPARLFLARTSQRFDFVFMDADKANYLDYFRAIEPLLAPGAVIVADNAIDYRELMGDFIAYLADNERYEGMILQVDNGLLLYRKLVD
ncbi:O-methyltransferase [Haliangium sp.]|uniref:O-methyltransferase n=1 Tax=Haliangium sp. TaxID=2663208 RepID=UPI003D0ED4FE